MLVYPPRYTIAPATVHCPTVRHLHPKQKKVGKDESKAKGASVQFLKEDMYRHTLETLAGLVPDHCNKVRHWQESRPHELSDFPVHIKVVFTLY